MGTDELRPDDLKPDDLKVVDLLEEFRAALDGLGPLLTGRTVDIEMPRLHVLADAAALRKELVGLVEAAVAHADQSDSITVRVARAGTSARIEIVNDRDGAGTGSSFTVPLAPGASGHADT